MDFRPDRRRLPARSRGCRQSWNASQQDRPERTYEAQITPVRRVGTRSGAHPSSPRAITHHRPHAPHTPRHPCRRPPVIPGEVTSPEPWKNLLREVRVQIGHKGAQPLFTEPHEPRNHAVLSGALSARCRLCIRFGHSHRSRLLSTPGTTWEAVRRRHRCPHSPGSGRDAPHRPATPSFSWISIVLSG